MTPTDRTLRALAEQGQRLEDARTQEADARNKMTPLIVAARKQGVPQQEVIRLSGLSRETVRGIERAGGIDAPAWVARTVAHS